MDYCKRLVKSSTGKIILYTFFSGIIVHIFSLMNVLHNYDDINVQSGYGTGIHSGRWVLTVVGDFVEKIWGNYNLPYVNGAVFLLLLAISAGILASVFELKSWKLGYLIGLLLVVYPSTTSLLFFKYTAVYYGISILLSVVAVWAAAKLKYGIIISALCIAVATGIYQAYLPLTISLFVILLIKKVLESNITFKECFFRGIYYCGCIIIGVIIYFIILKLCLYWYDTALIDYQGVSDMGKLSVGEIPSLIKNAFVSFCKLPISDYCKLAPTWILRLGYFILGVISIVIIMGQMIKEKKIGSVFMFLILAILFPIAVNFIVIMCPSGYIYTLMVFSFVTVLFVPVIVLDVYSLDKTSHKVWKNMGGTIVIVLMIMVCNYSYLTNVNYTAMYYTNRQTENYLNSMVTQVRMAEGFDPSKKWAFIGENITDPLIYNPWGGDVPLYSGNNSTYINRYSRERWIEKYYGYLIPAEDKEIVEELKNSPEVKNMPCWPNEGSIRVIDETVVIKLEEN